MFAFSSWFLWSYSQSLNSVNICIASCNSFYTTCCIFSAWIASQLSQVYNHTNLYLNIWIFKNYPQRIVSCNVNLSNLENVLQRNDRTKRGRSAILEKFTAQRQPYGAFVGSVYLPACQKKLWICHWQASEKVNWVKNWLYSWF